MNALLDLGQFLNIPYRADGRDCGGVDCWGLVCLAYAEAAIALPPHAATKAGQGFGVARAMLATKNSDQNWRKIGPDEALQPLDLALMTAPSRPEALPAHVGIAVGGAWLMHVEDGPAGVHLAAVTVRHIATRIVSWHRHKALDEIWDKTLDLNHG